MLLHRRISYRCNLAANSFYFGNKPLKQKSLGQDIRL